ncbi:DUF4153 domain-containing protein [Labrys neptuniae]
MPPASASPEPALLAHNRSSPRLSFILKVLAVTVLALLADFALSAGEALPQVGSIIGLLAFAWLGMLLACDPPMRRSRASRLAVLGASLAGFALIVEPSLLAALLFLAGLGLALFLPRYATFGNALVWAGRLMLYAIISPLASMIDATRLAVAVRRRKVAAPGGILLGLVVALGGAAVFLALFADANPLIGLGVSALWDWLASPSQNSGLAWHALFVLASMVMLWPSFRPSRLRIFAPRPALQAPAPSPSWPGVTPVVMALAAFNLVFAFQNVSDLTFLWSGVGLPEGLTFSQYANQGTQALILAALLAAGFVLVCLRTGSPLAARASVRLLVYGWIGQTMLLVASTMLRVLAYIEAYSLTYLRIATLIFLVLVMAGLALISWRIARRHNGVWLINANALCLAAVLGLCCFVNFDGVIARWNLGQPRPHDYGYIADLAGTGTLLALKDASSADEASEKPDLPYLRQLRATVQARLEVQQADWRRWTLAGALRLGEAGPLPEERPSTPALTPSP